MNDDRFAVQRRQMVDQQLRRRGIRDHRVLAAMAEIPRENFVPFELRQRAYGDYPLSIGESQTISQPYMVALMSDLLDLDEEDRVLELGTGSGYQTAILASIAREVYTVERIEPLAERAREALESLGFDNIRFRVGDGTLGWPEAAPFQRILVTAAAPDIIRDLIDQLEDGGKLVIPVGGRSFQTLKVITKSDQNNYQIRDEGGCVFVKLIGKHGWTF